MEITRPLRLLQEVVWILQESGNKFDSLCNLETTQKVRAVERERAISEVEDECDLLRLWRWTMCYLRGESRHLQTL